MFRGLQTGNLNLQKKEQMVSNRNGTQSTIDLFLWDGQDLWSTIVQIYTTIPQTDLHAFLQRTSCENVIKNQSIFFGDDFVDSYNLIS